MAQPLPIAGWYPDPEIPGHDRWWDGAGWTDNRRVASVAADSASPAAVEASAPGGSHGPGLYIPGEVMQRPAPAPTYAPAPVVRNNLALIGFILSLSGLILPFVVNSIAGGIVSIIGLRHSKKLAVNGIFSNGRGISIAGILIGFIWGGIMLLIVVGSIVFYIWILSVATNVTYSDTSVS